MLSLYKASAEAAVFRGRDGGFRKTARETAEAAETAEIRLPAGKTTLLLKNWVCGWKPYSANEFGYFLRIRTAAGEEPPAGMWVSP